MEVKTVMIETKNGPVRINESDFDSNKHTLVGKESEAKADKEAENAQAKADKEAQEARVSAVVAELIAKGVKLSVEKIGKGAKAKFIIIDSDGNNITDVEYNTEKEAIGFAFPQPK
jgi:regulator of protease activity HflC (stomatin/prohibitin superfamily)